MVEKYTGARKQKKQFFSDNFLVVDYRVKMVNKMPAFAVFLLYVFIVANSIQLAG